MASARSALVELLFQAETTSTGTAPDQGQPNTQKIAQTDRYSDGDGSGNINRVYAAAISLDGSPETLALDLGNASLSDEFGNTISGDECKALAVVCTTGQITVKGGAANAMSCFTGAGEGVVLTAGQFVCLGLGAAGIDISTNAKLALTDGGAAATGQIIGITTQ